MKLSETKFLIRPEEMCIRKKLQRTKTEKIIFIKNFQKYFQPPNKFNFRKVT